MKFLCRQYNVHNIPVGDNRTQDCVDNIVKEQPDLSCFFTRDTQVWVLFLYTLGFCFLHCVFLHKLVKCRYILAAIQVEMFKSVLYFV